MNKMYVSVCGVHKLSIQFIFFLLTCIFSTVYGISLLDCCRLHSLQPKRLKETENHDCSNAKMTIFGFLVQPLHLEQETVMPTG